MNLLNQLWIETTRMESFVFLQKKVIFMHNPMSYNSLTEHSIMEILSTADAAEKVQKN